MAMRSIVISEEVWNAIANRGRFGETEEDVLRRVFDLDPLEKDERAAFFAGATGRRKGRGATRYATKRMTAKVTLGRLIVEFADGERRTWELPYGSDKGRIRQSPGR